jgi:hypothetical protein
MKNIIYIIIILLILVIFLFNNIENFTMPLSGNAYIPLYSSNSYNKWYNDGPNIKSPLPDGPYLTSCNNLSLDPKNNILVGWCKQDITTINDDIHMKHTLLNYGTCEQPYNIKNNNGNLEC